MPHSEAQAWWADVQHVRESIERRRARGLDAAAPLDAATEARFARRAAESLPPLDDLDWSPGGLGQQPTGRFDRAPRHPRGDHSQPRARRGGSERRGADGAAERIELVAQEAEPADSIPPADERRTSRAARSESARLTDDARTTEPAAGAAFSAAPSRRTVTITGRAMSAPPLPRLVEVERRRPARRPAERVGPRPDRIALWAVLLGFFLILVAATSSNAAVPAAPASHGAAVALHAPAR